MLVPVPVPDWPTWQATYRPGIRVVVDWAGLNRARPRISRVYQPEPLVYPWTKDKIDFWQGSRRLKPVRHERFRGHFVVVAPAVLYAGRYMLLDHCHRIRDLRPTVLAVDALVITKQLKHLFGDLCHDRP